MAEDKYVMIGFIIALLILAASIGFNSIKACDVNIDYDVTVDPKINGTSRSIAEVKLACYKMCIDNLRRSDTLQRFCFNKCEVLE